MSGKRFLIVGVDGSASATAALRWAMRYAAATGTEVVAVTACASPPAVGGSRLALDELVGQTRPPAVTVGTRAVVGDPAQVLLAAAEDADLLVLGSHGHGLGLHALLGSVSAQCLRFASCPVVILPVRCAGRTARDGAVSLEAK
ncbi:MULTISPECIES: universal stress protein [Amycolatopsis]|uniref:Nucleotide-binding universal stress protein, UspA family n=2 Tax=Amycolatopsis TaxID=1813 RepID=A0A1I3KZK4_9PSEU|nr:universal stress protein [Amycolatopsis sacchari]SFI77814.1 Nucleotide-binding universal stress protein, UspA family [Amycolatopsis sacchari]